MGTTGQEWVEQATAGHADHTRETSAAITEKCRHCQAEREAVRNLGRRGGKAGTGKAKRRGDSAYYRGIRAKAPKPQRHEASGEWAGYTVRESRRGWIVDVWSRIQGQQDGARYLVSYCTAAPRTLALDQPINESGTLGAGLVHEIARGGEARVLRRGHVVR